MNLDKRELILESIIEAYLESNDPIGSSELGSRMEEAIPASTIRVYFKKLSEIGAITQLHISSGRIPTAMAMNYYWNQKLDFKDKIKIKDAEVLSYYLEEFDIYCMILGKMDLKLNSVSNLNDKFILMDFDEECLAIKFNPKIENLLANLLGTSLKDLKQISAQVGLSELRMKINEFQKSLIYFQDNEKIIFDIYQDYRIKELLNPDFERKFKGNLAFEPLFDEGFMGLKFDVNFEGKDATMICAGSIYNDYEKFLKNIKEVA